MILRSGDPLGVVAGQLHLVVQPDHRPAIDFGRQGVARFVIFERLVERLLGQLAQLLDGRPIGLPPRTRRIGRRGMARLGVLNCHRLLGRRCFARGRFRLRFLGHQVGNRKDADQRQANDQQHGQQGAQRRGTIGGTGGRMLGQHGRESFESRGNFKARSPKSEVRSTNAQASSLKPFANPTPPPARCQVPAWSGPSPSPGWFFGPGRPRLGECGLCRRRQAGRRGLERREVEEKGERGKENGERRTEGREGRPSAGCPRRGPGSATLRPHGPIVRRARRPHINHFGSAGSSQASLRGPGAAAANLHFQISIHDERAGRST